MSRKKEETRKRRTASLVRTLVFFAALLLLCTGCSIIYRANMDHYVAHLNSDIAAEGLLAADIAENGMRMPKTWVGSTETRVFSTANLAALIYYFSGDMNRSMGLACFVYFLIVLVCMYLFLLSSGYGRPASFLVLASSAFFTGSMASLNVFSVFAGFYDSYLAVMFLVFALYGICLGRTGASADRKDPKKAHAVPVWIWISGPALSLLAGTEGFHSLLLGFLPLFAAEFLRQIILLIRLTHEKRIEKRREGALHLFLQAAGFDIFLWTIALVITNVLTIRFTGASSQDTSRNIRHASQKFKRAVWPQIKEAVSPQRSVPVFFILLVLAILAWIYLIVKKQEVLSQHYAVIAMLMSVLVPAAAGTLTTAESATRYYVTLNFAIPAAAGFWIPCILDEQSQPAGVPKRVLGTLSAALLVLYTALGFPWYRAMLLTDPNDDYISYKEGTDWMKEKGLTLGYATFDYANLLSGISNHSVTIGCIGEPSTMRILGWLSDERWYPPFTPTDQPVVYIISDARMNEFLEFLEGRPDITILDEAVFDNLHFIILPQNYMHWDSLT